MDPTGERADRYARAGDLGPVAEVLRARREEILGRWLAAVERQPFHAGRSAGAVADHIPRLFDARVELLSRGAPPAADPGAPLDDPSLRDAAKSHARARIAQGLTTGDVVQEFRLLRQEVGRALRLHLPAASPQSDAVAAELLAHDALDAAVFIAISAISAHEAERLALLDEAERARAEAEDAVRLRDTGFGIPAGERESVFEPFQRGSNVRSVTGTGVGLAAARHTVKRHGGAISVASDEGSGTTVTVRLPLADSVDPAPRDGTGGANGPDGARTARGEDS